MLLLHKVAMFTAAIKVRSTLCCFNHFSTMQSFAVTGANNTILTIVVVSCSSNCGTSTNNTPLIVGLAVGLGGGFLLLASFSVFALVYLHHVRKNGKIWAVQNAPALRSPWPEMSRDEEPQVNVADEGGKGSSMAGTSATDARDGASTSGQQSVGVPVHASMHEAHHPITSTSSRFIFHWPFRTKKMAPQV